MANNDTLQGLLDELLPSQDDLDAIAELERQERERLSSLLEQLGEAARVPTPRQPKVGAAPALLAGLGDLLHNTRRRKIWEPRTNFSGNVINRATQEAFRLSEADMQDFRVKEQARKESLRGQVAQNQERIQELRRRREEGQDRRFEITVKDAERLIRQMEQKGESLDRLRDSVVVELARGGLTSSGFDLETREGLSEALAVAFTRQREVSAEGKTDKDATQESQFVLADASTLMQGSNDPLSPSPSFQQRVDSATTLAELDALQADLNRLVLLPLRAGMLIPRHRKTAEVYAAEATLALLEKRRALQAVSEVPRKARGSSETREALEGTALGRFLSAGELFTQPGGSIALGNIAAGVGDRLVGAGIRDPAGLAGRFVDDVRQNPATTPIASALRVAAQEQARNAGAPANPTGAPGIGSNAPALASPRLGRQVQALTGNVGAFPWTGDGERDRWVMANATAEQARVYFDEMSRSEREAAARALYQQIAGR